MRLKLCCAVTAIALALAGCGDDSSSDSGGDQAAGRTTAGTSTVVRYTNTIPQPRNPGPHPGARVDQLVIRDVKVGTGPEIHAGDDGVFDFISTNWITGETLENSWRRRGRPFETTVERNVVIDGWWQGIPGMRVGGRRQILIPPSLGFTQSIDASMNGATTYFDVVLLEVRPVRPPGLGGRGPASDPTQIG